MDNDKKHHTEEISLFELFGYIKKGFNRIGDALLRFFAFLVRNAIILIALVVIGIVAGFFMDKATPQSVRTEVVVVAGFGSSDYLYESVEDINYKLQKKDSLFFEKMDLDTEKDYGFSLEINPVPMLREINGDQENYFDLLKENESISEEERQAIINKSYEQHKLVLFHQVDAPAKSFLTTLMDHLRENSHYREVFQLMQKSLDRQIESNIYMLAQIDSLLANYSKNPGTGSAYTENSIDLGNLLVNRMEMQEETRELQQQKIASQGFLKIIAMNMAQPMEDTSVFDKNMVALPLLLLGIFFLICLLARAYRKARKNRHFNRKG